MELIDNYLICRDELNFHKEKFQGALDTTSSIHPARAVNPEKIAKSKSQLDSRIFKLEKFYKENPIIALFTHRIPSLFGKSHLSNAREQRAAFEECTDRTIIKAKLILQNKAPASSLDRPIETDLIFHGLFENSDEAAIEQLLNQAAALLHREITEENLQRLTSKLSKYQPITLSLSQEVNEEFFAHLLEANKNYSLYLKPQDSEGYFIEKPSEDELFLKKISFIKNTQIKQIIFKKAKENNSYSQVLSNLDILRQHPVRLSRLTLKGEKKLAKAIFANEATLLKMFNIKNKNKGNSIKFIEGFKEYYKLKNDLVKARIETKKNVTTNEIARTSISILEAKISLLKDFYKEHKVIKFFTETLHLPFKATQLTKAVEYREKLYAEIGKKRMEDDSPQSSSASDSKDDFDIYHPGMETPVSLAPAAVKPNSRDKNYGKVRIGDRATDDIYSPKWEAPVREPGLNLTALMGKFEQLFTHRDQGEARQLIEAALKNKSDDNIDTRRLEALLTELNNKPILRLSTNNVENENFLQALLFKTDDPLRYISGHKIKIPEKIIVDELINALDFLKDDNIKEAIIYKLNNATEEGKARIFANLALARAYPDNLAGISENAILRVVEEDTEFFMQTFNIE
ncbi:hypothetical protein PHSC3_001886 [Chlamydiales bacterium STE3]|nr:hypothetical protein PHSC3_001886 [Chlamydiales bacterium STE3]